MKKIKITNKGVIRGLDEVLALLETMVKPVIEHGFANDSHLLMAITSKSQELKARWQRTADRKKTAEKVGHWSGPSKAYIQNRGAEHAD